MSEWIRIRPSKEDIEYEPVKDFGAALNLALSLLPKKAADFISKKYVICLPTDMLWEAICLSFDNACFKDKVGCIVFSSDSRPLEQKRINFLFAHEVAHAWLIKNKKANTEIEADKLAVKWLSKHYKKSDLMRECEYWKQ